MEIQYLALIVGAVALAGLAGYLYLDFQARVLRTRLISQRAGLRFEAYEFTVEVKRATSEVVIYTRSGLWIRTPTNGGAAQERKGPLDTTLPAAGLHIDVAPANGTAGGRSAPRLYSIVLRGTDPQDPQYQSTVRMDRIPASVAASFSQFAARVRVWVEKIERRAELDRIAQVRREEEAARAAEDERLRAEMLANKAADAPLTDADREALKAAQIAKWREAAGFTGSSTEVSVDAEGRIDWFIDLANDGRVTLHADKRTIHANLRGASIETVGGEIEIGVRDEYWTEDEPALRYFRLFKGMPPDARRAWKEKLELVRNSQRRSIDDDA